MGQDNRHGRSSVPDSMPPELDDIDSSWDDDLPLDESAEIPIADPASELDIDRVTAVPVIPTEQYAAQLMAEVEATAPAPGQAEPEEEEGPGSLPDIEFDEPDLEPGSGLRALDEAPPEEPRLVVLPDEPLPELPRQPPSEAPAPDPTRSLGLSEPGSADTHTIPPLIDQDAVPTAPPPRARRAPSREFDDLSLDLSDPAGPPLDPVEDRVTPAVPSLELDLPSAPDAADQDPALANMKDRYAMGDFTGALVIAESMLETDPEDLEARRYAQSCREVLTQMYAARLGQLDQRAVVAIPADQIRWLSLDHRAGFLLSLIDGSSSIEELLDISGMTRLDALRILYNLLEQRVVALEPA